MVSENVKLTIFLKNYLILTFILLMTSKEKNEIRIHFCYVLIINIGFRNLPNVSCTFFEKFYNSDITKNFLSTERNISRIVSWFVLIIVLFNCFINLRLDYLKKQNKKNLVERVHTFWQILICFWYFKKILICSYFFFFLLFSCFDCSLPFFAPFVVSAAVAYLVKIKVYILL